MLKNLSSYSVVCLSKKAVSFFIISYPHSLNDSIADLRNEIASLKKVDLKEDLHVPNPVLPPKDNKPKKTEHDYRQTDLTEGLESLLRHIV